jgi:reverse transcriptase-like protein
MIMFWEGQKVKVLVEFKKILSQPLENDWPVVIEGLSGLEENSDDDVEYELINDNEFEEKELEDQIFALSEIDYGQEELRYQDNGSKSVNQEFDFLKMESKESSDDNEVSEIINCYFDIEEEEEIPVFHINPELSEENKSQLDLLLNKNIQGFAFSTEQLGRTDVTKHHIYSGDTILIKQKPYRYSSKKKQFLQEETERMLKEGIILTTSSPWTSPVVLVKQKDKTWICIDYRKLNAITKKDNYTLLQIDDLLDMLKNSSWYISLDLASDYWQVEMNSADKEKTAFITPFGTY